jgi:DnaK suppressor protein
MKKHVTLVKKLRKMRADILKELDDNISTERRAPQRDVGDFYDDAESEKGSQLNHLLSERDRSKLAGIDNALEKIEDDTYGICDECGCDIPKKRLNVLPFARCCIECQSEMERQGITSTETMEDKLLYKDVSITDIERNDE